MFLCLEDLSIMNSNIEESDELFEELFDEDMYAEDCSEDASFLLMLAQETNDSRTPENQSSFEQLSLFEIV